MICNDSNGCELEAAVYNVVASLTPPDSYRDLSKGEGVNLYPNPVEDKVTIHIPIDVVTKVKNGTTPQGVLRTVEISVYNMIGEKVMNQGQEAINMKLEATFDVSMLPEGIYIIEIPSNSTPFRAKFVKQ